MITECSNDFVEGLHCRFSLPLACEDEVPLALLGSKVRRVFWSMHCCFWVSEKQSAAQKVKLLRVSPALQLFNSYKI